MNRALRELGDSGDEVGEEEEGRREDAVGDVDVQEVGEGLDAGEVALEVGEVGRPERELAEEPVPGKLGGDAQATVSTGETAARKPRIAARASAAQRTGSSALG